MPPDLAGYVLSRSSYGRIGLIVATATFIHPDWRGCLTLELVNLGNTPLRLYSGSLIAQLVLHQATPERKVESQKSIPTGPEFSTLSSDPFWTRLREIRRLAGLYESNSDE